MRNPVFDIVGNQPTDNTQGLLQMAMSIRPRVNRPTRNNRVSLLSSLGSSRTAKLPTGNTNTATVDNNSSDKLIDWVNDTKRQGIKYSQENRYKPGYGDCSTYACKLQKEVFNRDVPDTTLGMINTLPKRSTRVPGTMSVYDTGNGKRHVVTWLPNGNVIGLSPSGVKELPGNYYDNRYPLIGNY
jgi:hypothetical protein